MRSPELMPTERPSPGLHEGGRAGRQVPGWRAARATWPADGRPIRVGHQSEGCRNPGPERSRRPSCCAATTWLS